MVTGQTWSISSWPWNLFEQYIFPLSLLATVFGHNWTLTKQIFLLPHWVIHYWRWFCPRSYFLCFMLLSVFLVAGQFLSNWSCFDWSFWHHLCQSIFVGGRARTMDYGLVTGFLFPPPPRLMLRTRFVLLTKCRICHTLAHKVPGVI